MKKSRFLAVALTLAMLLGLCVPSAFAAGQFSDVEGHWAESAIERWTGYGVLNGRGDSFDPDAGMTRAEFSKMLANMMGYTQKAENVFTDMIPGAWYEEPMLQLMAAGVLNGNGDGTATPDTPITREQAAVMLCRAFDIKPSANATLTYVDSANVSSWARDSMAALLERGMMGGIGDNVGAPKMDMNRASIAKLTDNMIAEYVTADTTITGHVDGIVLVVGGVNVKLDNAKIDAPVIVAPKASGADVSLTGTTSAENVVVEGSGTKVNVGAEASAVSVTAAATGASVTVEGTVNSVGVTGASARVNVSGTVGTVSTSAENTNITVSGTVSNVDVGSSASGASVTASAGGKIDSVETAANNVSVSGSGDVGSVTATGGSADVTTKGTEVTNQGAGSVTANGETVASGNSATSSGSGTGSGTGSGSGGSNGSTYWEGTDPGSSGGGDSSGGGNSDGGNNNGGGDCDHKWENTGEANPAVDCITDGRQKQTCSLCKATQTVITKADGKTHVTSENTYAHDEYYHWKKCSKCGAEVDRTAHAITTDEEGQKSCTVNCGQTTFPETDINVADCVWQAGDATKQANCTTAGQRTDTCTAPGHDSHTRTEDIPATGHSFGGWEPPSGGGDKHVRTCSKCQTKDEEAHGFGDWKVAPSSKSEQPAHMRSCPTCGYEEIETHTGEWSTKTDGSPSTKTCTKCATELTCSHPKEADGYPKTTEADCTTGGKTEHKCATCAATWEAGGTGALGHDLQVVTVGSGQNAPTEENHTLKCSRCSYTQTEAHNPEEPDSSENACRCGWYVGYSD